jgi:lipoic acid synthetase
MSDTPVPTTRIVVDHRTARHPEKANRPDNPIQRKPAWIRVKAPDHPVLQRDAGNLMRTNKLATVCEEAACPNIGECWSQRHATMMIMGETCTRACSFCNVRTGQPDPLDATEPAASPTRSPNSACATSSSRRSTVDDVPDGGAAHFAAVIRAVRDAAPSNHHRGADPRFPAQARRRRKSWPRRRPTCSTTISKRHPALPLDPAGRALLTSRSACSTP